MEIHWNVYLGITILIETVTLTGPLNGQLPCIRTVLDTLALFLKMEKSHPLWKTVLQLETVFSRNITSVRSMDRTSSDWRSEQNLCLVLEVSFSFACLGGAVIDQNGDILSGGGCVLTLPLELWPLCGGQGKISEVPWTRILWRPRQQRCWWDSGWMVAVFSNCFFQSRGCRK